MLSEAKCYGKLWVNDEKGGTALYPRQMVQVENAHLQTSPG